MGVFCGDDVTHVTHISSMFSVFVRYSCALEASLNKTDFHVPSGVVANDVDDDDEFVSLYSSFTHT